MKAVVEKTILTGGKGTTIYLGTALLVAGNIGSLHPNKKYKLFVYEIDPVYEWQWAYRLGPSQDWLISDHMPAETVRSNFSTWVDWHRLHNTKRERVS